MCIRDRVRDVSGVIVPDNRPVVGDNLFKVESGIIATWLLNCGDEHQTEVMPFRPRMVGQDEPETVMGKGSGIDTVKEWLARIQVVVDDEKSMEVLMAVKDWGLIHKRLMTSEEFQAVAKDVLDL